MINFGNLKILNNKLHFDVYHKPTNCFSYLHYKSCHPPHTRNNTALSLATRIVWIVTDNKDNRLQKLEGHLLKRKHPEKIIDYSFTKLFQPRKHKNNTKILLHSLELTILIINFLLASLKIALKILQIENSKKHLMIKKIPFTTRQPKKIRNLLVPAKSETETISKARKLILMW